MCLLLVMLLLSLLLSTGSVIVSGLLSSLLLYWHGSHRGVPIINRLWINRRLLLAIFVVFFSGAFG